MIRDFIYKPLVRVDQGEQAYLLHLGSKIPARRLTGEWHWHWPALSLIRIFDDKPLRITFASPTKDGQDLMTIEPIVCLSRDHHLYRLSGQLELHLSWADIDSSSSKLLRQGLRSIHRALESSIRQCLRQVVAEQPSHKLVNPSLTRLAQQLQRRLQSQLDPGLSCHSCIIETVEPFRLGQIDPDTSGD